jgi:beta-galactosidase
VASPEHKRVHVRQGDPDFQAFHHDLYRAVGAMRNGRDAAGGRWWIMEQQPGPVNWAPYNPDPLPGMARLWAWEAFAHGAEAVCYFRWRQAPFAQEQMHAGLLRPDSVAAPAFEEAGQVARELTEMPDVAGTAAPVALVFDYASAWAWQTQPQGRNFDYFRLVFHFYKGLRALGLSIDIIPPDTSDLSPWKVVVAPGVATLPSAFLAALEQFKGIALIGPRSNSKTPDFATPVPLPPNLPGLDCTVTRVESLPPDVPVPLAEGGAFLHWREKLEGAAVSERARDGVPAVMAAGGIRYLGGWPDEEARQRLLSAACDDAGVPTETMEASLRQRDSGGMRFLFNYGAEPATHHGVTVPAAGVHWSPL